MAESPLARRFLIAAVSELDANIEEACRNAAVATDCEFIHCPTPASLDSVLNEAGWAFVLRQQRTVDELRAEVRFIREFKTEINEGRLILISLNGLDHNRSPGLLRKMGFKEVISISSIRPQALKARIETVLKGGGLFEGRRAPARPDSNGDLLDQRRRNTFEFVEPLQLPENCWLLRKPEDIRIVNDQWIVDLVGPGPSAGIWTKKSEAELNPENGHSVWEWRPRSDDPRNPFFGENGSWVFWGKRPRFQDFHWTFISKDPKLSFFRDKEPVSDVLSLNSERRLTIPANSEIALKKWPAIHASVINEYKYTVKAAVIENPVMRFEKAKKQEIAWRDLMGINEEQQLQESKTQALTRIQRGLAPKGELFSRVANDVQRLGYLRELKKNAGFAPVQVWTPGQKVRCNAEICDVIEDLPAIILALPSGINMEDLFGRLYLNISYKRGSVFFAVEAREIGFDGDRLVIRVPSSIYEVQRRSFFRLQIGEDQDWFVRCGDRFYRILNISAGGLAFLADSREESGDPRTFKRGATLESISFEVGGILIRCKAEIRWTKKESEAAGGADLAVGIQFQTLNPVDQQRINLFVLEEGFEYLREHIV